MFGNRRGLRGFSLKRQPNGRLESRRDLRIRQGQVMLEFAMALVGFAVFLTVLLRIWLWLNTMIVGRQAAFQDTRQAAGSSQPGIPVSYARPPIKLLGDPGRPGTGSVGIPVDPPCTAGDPFYARAQQLLDEAEQLRQQIIPKRDAMNRLGEEMEALSDRINRLDPDDDEDEIRRLARQIDAKGVASRQLGEEVRALGDQAQQDYQDATDLIRQGDAACP